MGKSTPPSLIFLNMKKYLSKNVYGIEVMVATDKEIKKIRKAINFIKNEDSKSFNLLKRLRAILVISTKGYDNQLFMREKVYVCQTDTILESSMSYLASLFIHEARHIWQYYKNWKKNYGNKAEKDAYDFQRKFLLKFGGEGEVEWLDKLFKEKWWVYRGKNGKKTLISPKTGLFTKFISQYLANKL